MLAFLEILTLAASHDSPLGISADGVQQAIIVSIRPALYKYL